MSACYCDFEVPEFLSQFIYTARKPHKCVACGTTIQPGCRYERCSGKWDGCFETYSTCSDCLEFREWMLAHVPCFCWTLQELFDEASETLLEYAHHVPGMGMEGGRMLVAMRRRMRAARQRRGAP